MALRYLPFLTWLPLLRSRDTLRADLMAGLTGAIVVLPQGVAFATIAGMPPEYGLYAAMVPAIVAALFGSSHHLVSGPTTAASIVLFASLSALAEPGSERAEVAHRGLVDLRARDLLLDVLDPAEDSRRHGEGAGHGGGRRRPRFCDNVVTDHD